MSGRPKIFEDETVINKAKELFWLKGYELTSTEELLKAMGIGKGSFYLAFKGGKRELFEKVLEMVSRQELQAFNRELEVSEKPVEALKDLFRGIGTASRETNLKGCFFGHTVAEFSNTDTALMNLAAQHLAQLETLFLKVIKNAQEQGDLKTQENPVLLASHLITIWNGLGISRRIFTQSGSLSPLIELQLKVLH